MPLGGYIGMRYIVSPKLPKMLNFFVFSVTEPQLPNGCTYVLETLSIMNVSNTQDVPSEVLTLFILTKIYIFVKKYSCSITVATLGCNIQIYR